MTREEAQKWWAFQPLPKLDRAEPVAEVKHIDGLVNRELVRCGLKPAPAADKRTLIRRLTYDLTGLPPTPEEVQAFLADERRRLFPESSNDCFTHRNTACNGGDVRRGEVVLLSVSPNASHGADSTLLEWSIRETGGQQRSWNVADLVADLMKGNSWPAAHEAIWSFLEITTTPVYLTPSTKQLPEWELREKRMTVTPRYGTAFTDSVFMTSRDGRNFRQSNDLFLPPGLRTRHNWSYGDNYIARHVVETASTKDDSPRELSLYATESYFTGRNSRLRRYSLRIDGFSSMHAKLQPGEFTTKPITFTGKELSLNVATSAAGKVQVALQNPDGSPIPGFTREDCDLIFGDSLDYRVSWKGNTSVAALIGKPVVLKVRMQEADLYSLVFD